MRTFAVGADSVVAVAGYGDDPGAIVVTPGRVPVGCIWETRAFSLDTAMRPAQSGSGEGSRCAQRLRSDSPRGSPGLGVGTAPVRRASRPSRPAGAALARVEEGA
jgi:hypothetical protein